jgi:hypothetical protein
VTPSSTPLPTLSITTYGQRTGTVINGCTFTCFDPNPTGGTANQGMFRYNKPATTAGPQLFMKIKLDGVSNPAIFATVNFTSEYLVAPFNEIAFNFPNDAIRGTTRTTTYYMKFTNGTVSLPSGAWKVV